MELVSIIIPAYNTARLIGKCLSSVVEQTYKNLEIIVVNDASTDNTLQVITEFADKDFRIKIINHEINKGNGIGRNNAIRAATGKFVYFVDSDDYIEPNAVEVLVNSITTSRSDVVVLGHYMHCGKILRKDKIIKFSPAIPNDIEKNELFKQFLLQTYGFQIPPWKYFTKREILLENNVFFDESGDYFEDVIFATKLVFYAKKITSVPNLLYHYVLRTGSIMGTYSYKSIQSKFSVITKMKDFLKEENAFDLYREEYSMFFLIEGFLESCSRYIQMRDRHMEIEQFLYEISQSDFIQQFDVQLIKSINPKNKNGIAYIQKMITEIQKDFHSYIATQRSKNE